MKTEKYYFIEIKGALDWWRVGKTKSRKAAYEFKRRQEAQGDEVRVIAKTY